jgi:hypothetical protein
MTENDCAQAHSPATELPHRRQSYLHPPPNNQP